MTSSLSRRRLLGRQCRGRHGRGAALRPRHGARRTDHHAAGRHDRRGHPVDHRRAGPGAEGHRFLGITLYDPLAPWDLSSGHAAVLRPGLAERWPSIRHRTRWTFTLRQGVRFHDGSALPRRRRPWNLALMSDAPQFDRQQAAQGASSPNIARWRAATPTPSRPRRAPTRCCPGPGTSSSSRARWEEAGRNWERLRTASARVPRCSTASPRGSGWRPCATATTGTPRASRGSAWR